MARAKTSKPDLNDSSEGFPIGNGKNPINSEPESTDKAPVLIIPTIGRMVLYNDGFSDQRCAAQIAYVHNNGCINIGYLDRNGLAQSATSVMLIQDKNIECLVGSCEWMEYQVNQVK